MLAALREVREETGHLARPGRPLGEVRYRVGSAPKRVRYWAAEAVDGEFTPGDEVDEVRWLAPGDARSLLSTPRDREVVARFLADAWATVPLLVVRHASAGDRHEWTGDDRLRPLDERGVRQAESIAELFAAYAVEVVCAADVVRCQDTLQPFADAAGLSVRTDPRLGSRADPAAGVDALTELAARGRPAVVCTQREVLARLVSGACSRLGVPTVPSDVGEVPRGSVVALHVTGRTRLVDREWLSGPVSP